MRPRPASTGPGPAWTSCADPFRATTPAGGRRPATGSCCRPGLRAARAAGSGWPCRPRTGPSRAPGRPPWRDPAQVVDRLGQLQPRRRGRHGQDLDRPAGHGEGVAGVEQAAPDQVADVGHDRDVGVDDGVVAPGHGQPQPAQLQLVAVVDDLDVGPGLAKGLGAALVADHPHPRVAVQQPPHPPGVEVVAVLVGDAHRGQPVQLLEPLGERARVEQHPGPALLHQQARVPELGQAHAVTSVGQISSRVSSRSSSRSMRCITSLLIWPWLRSTTMAWRWATSSSRTRRW